MATLENHVIFDISCIGLQRLDVIYCKQLMHNDVFC